MNNRNDGSNTYLLQNQFTAYIKKAVHNRRLRYLQEQSRKITQEIDWTDIELFQLGSTDYTQNFVDLEVMHQALRAIKEKERHIVLSRVVEEKSFDEIADKLGMTYKAVTSLYYRVMKKLREYMKGSDNDEFQ